MALRSSPARPRRLPFAVPVALAAAAVAFPSGAAASLSPATASFTLAPGGHVTEHKTIGIPATPPKADIEIAIDTTGSMGSTIAAAKADAQQIVHDIQAQVPDSQFAVVQFKDAGDSPEYGLVQPMTASASAVQTAVNGLSASGGNDAPEAYNLVFHRATDAATGWRSGTRKFVVVLGDAQPHGAGTAGFSSCTDTSADPHGYNTATELQNMRTAQRTLFMIRQVSSATTTSLDCYKQLAAAAYPTGDAVDHGGSLSTEIVGLINTSFSHVQDVHLEVASASPSPASASWISFNPAALTNVAAPSSQAVDLTATVPNATPPGTYTFDIVAKADGVDIGHQTLTLTVNAPPDCSHVHLDTTSLWPPNHKFVTITASGATDPDPGDSATLVIDGISQDEPLDAGGDGSTTPDATLTSPRSNHAQVRAERSGSGDGRVYRVHTTATDTHGATCTATLKVGVPHDQGHGPAVDSAPPSYNSLG